ncbi:DUF3592 domain-containing protein [Vibrio owensii]|uniref:DUF3592 domain-containing protein n=1 Tax=Vibrio owensii TaxID=696485 RepID=UPI003CC5CBD5
MTSALVFGLLGAGIFAYSAKQEYQETNELIDSVLAERKSQKKWKSVRAKVTSIKIGLEHEDYFSYLNSINGDMSDTQKAKAGELLAIASENVRLHGDIRLTYEYEFQGVRYSSRTLSCLPNSKKAIDLAKKFASSKGKSVKAYVNPKKPDESVLYLPKVEDIEAARWEIIKTDKGMMSKAALSVLIICVILFSI